MKVALAQIAPISGDLDGNLKRIVDKIEWAQDQKAHLVVFPEMCLTGYCILDLVEDDHFVETNRRMLEEIGKSCKSTAAVVGFVDFDQKKKSPNGKYLRYNAAAVMQYGKIVGITHKTLLPSYRYFDDSRYFTPGKVRKPIEIKVNGKKLKLGVTVCEDMWDENYAIKPVKEQIKKGAKLIVNINASPYNPQKIEERIEIIERHVKQSKVPFVYVNTVGAGDNGKNIIPFDGQSLVYDKSAKLIAIGKQFKRDHFIIDLNEKNPSLPKPKYHKEKEIFNALVMSLKYYAKRTGFDKAIISVSGGIDSALGLAITVEAFGKEDVVAYNLPSQFNTEITKSLAELVVKNFDVEYKIIPIEKIDNVYREEFERNCHQIYNPVSKENLHARIRGNLMMLESNESNALLISNGNKTEIALGYATLYGDMCGGISIIGDLSKMDVYAVARYINEKYGWEVIPEKIFKLRPSAELGPNQFDPFDYPIVSPLADLLVEERLSVKEIIERFKKRALGSSVPKRIYTEYDKTRFTQLIKHLYSLQKISVYKRLQGPPIVAVSERSFGFDLRETIINKWEGI
jgi:NAD+ synthase (glutamine-hydrolysing)